MTLRRIVKALFLPALAILILASYGCGNAAHDPEESKNGTAASELPGSGTAGATEPGTEPETEPVTEHVHTPAAEYTVDREPTCKTAGAQSYHCVDCGKPVPGTEVEIPADPEKHVINDWDWTETPASFWKKGLREGICSECGQGLTEELDYTVPVVYVSNWDVETRAFMPYTKGNEFRYALKIREMDNYEPFFPDYENPDGNDLLVEFSILWNESLHSLGGDLTVMHIEDYNLFNISLTDGTISSRERTGDVYLYPTEEEIKAFPALKKVPIQDYGWHRIGVRIHQEATVEDGSLKNTYIASIYLDGEMVIQVDKSAWVFEGDYGKGRTVSDASLFKAELVNGKIDYYEHTLLNEIRICHENFYKAGDPSYLVIADISVTCGKDFVENVGRTAVPVTGEPFEAAAGVFLPATRYFTD